ncbi:MULTISPECIES: lysozyme inhibitor LprI family protein [unclassified Microcoleus]|uniref:lysozyme inhibitor LprI family protein n=1 Tax=unclassified Microcoleus TaxID=2642155 RepID=UPI002FD46A31
MKGRSIFNAVVGLAIVGFTSSPVFAESKGTIEVTPTLIAQQHYICENATTNIEINRCLRLRYDASDKRLNQVYKQLMSKLSRQERSTLIKIQRQWIKSRDQDCNLEVSINRGGTGYSGFLNQCLERKTTQRTAELQSRLKKR